VQDNLGHLAPQAGLNLGPLPQPLGAPAGGALGTNHSLARYPGPVLVVGALGVVLLKPLNQWLAPIARHGASPLTLIPRPAGKARALGGQLGWGGLDLRRRA